jgi:hypothetical protein
MQIVQATHLKVMQYVGKFGHNFCKMALITIENLNERG